MEWREWGGGGSGEVAMGVEGVEWMEWGGGGESDGACFCLFVEAGCAGG